MKAALVIAVLSILLGCAATSVTVPPREPRNCPPLPELPPVPTSEQRAVHYATVIRLYVQCAGQP